MSSQLNLAQLTEIFKEIPESAYSAPLYGWGELISWRGSYSELSLTYGESSSIGSAFSELMFANGKTFTGYKGGDFVMHGGTCIWGDNYGDVNEYKIKGIRFVLDKKDMKNPRAEIIREY